MAYSAYGYGFGGAVATNITPQGAVTFHLADGVARTASPGNWINSRPSDINTTLPASGYIYLYSAGCTETGLLRANATRLIYQWDQLPAPVKLYTAYAADVVSYNSGTGVAVLHLVRSGRDYGNHNVNWTAGQDAWIYATDTTIDPTDRTKFTGTVYLHNHYLTTNLMATGGKFPATEAGAGGANDFEVEIIGWTPVVRFRAKGAKWETKTIQYVLNRHKQDPGELIEEARVKVQAAVAVNRDDPALGHPIIVAAAAPSAQNAKVGEKPTEADWQTPNVVIAIQPSDDWLDEIRK